MRFACKRRSRFQILSRIVLIGFLLSFFPTSLSAEEPAVEQMGATQKRLTLQFQGVDIVEILKLLADQAGFNMVAGKNVTGKVTLFLKEVDSWEALEVILAANDLAYDRRGQILTIMTRQDYELLYGQPYQDKRILKSIVPRYAKVADLGRSLAQVKSNVGRVITDEVTNTVILMDIPAVVDQMMKLIQEMDQPVETRIYSFNYGAVKTLAPMLQDAITKGMGRVSVDERTNQVAVTDYPSKLEEINRLVKAFDERSTQVLIEAKIIQVTLSDQFQMGVDWTSLANKFVTVKGLGALNLAAGGQLTVATPQLTSKGNYKVLIEALRTFGDSKILSEPRITALNGQEAKILVGSKEPYVTSQISQAGTGTSVTAEQVNYIDIGVKLFVTPTIAREGFVSMKIRPEVSSKTGTLTTSQKNTIPIVETSEAETSLLVQDGATIILGGLIKDEKSKDHQRIPVLGDLPFVGLLFRSTKDTVKKTELIFFLTPHIITGERVVSPLAAPMGSNATPVDGAS